MNNLKKIEIYERLFDNNLLNYIQNQNDRNYLKKLVFFGIKYIAYNENVGYQTIESLENKIEEITIILKFAKKLTINEFINIFPIKKEYDGEKYQSKDYFFVMEILSGKNKNDCIGDNISEFLWDYYNSYVIRFLLVHFQAINDYNRLHNKETLTDIITRELNIPVYTKVTHKNKEYLIDIKNKKTIKLAKQYPHYLRRIK